MYKIHREFGTAWYVTTSRHTQQSLAKDVINVRYGLSAIIMNEKSLSRDQIMHLLKQHTKKLEAVYNQMIEPILGIEVAEHRGT